MEQWDVLHKKAKSLEGVLEKKIQSYSSLAQRINANFLDEEGKHISHARASPINSENIVEGSFLESNDEQLLAAEIERDLAELYDCIQNMRQLNGAPLTNSQEAWIRRYYEIHFDYSTEFKNTAATVQRKRESMELMHSSKQAKSSEKDSSVAKLLREKISIANSMRNINEVLSQAFETRDTLNSQRGSLNNSTGGLSSISSNVPGIGRLIDGIQKKKYKESMTIALVIGMLICFVIWWTFLR